MVKFAHLYEAFLEFFELEASPVEVQSLQQKKKNKGKKRSKKKNKKKKNEKPKDLQKLSNWIILISVHA